MWSKGNGDGDDLTLHEDVHGVGGCLAFVQLFWPVLELPRRPRNKHRHHSVPIMSV